MAESSSGFSSLIGALRVSEGLSLLDGLVAVVAWVSLDGATGLGSDLTSAAGISSGSLAAEGLAVMEATAATLSLTAEVGASPGVAGSVFGVTGGSCSMGWKNKQSCEEDIRELCILYIESNWQAVIA